MPPTSHLLPGCHYVLPAPRPHPSAQIQPKGEGDGDGGPSVAALGKGCSPHPPCPGEGSARGASPRPATRPARSGRPPLGVSEAPRQRRPPPRRALLSPPGGAWTTARGDCTRSPPRACSSARVGGRQGLDRLRPQSLPSPSPQTPSGAGWSQSGYSLPGSLSALDSTVAMAEAPVRVRAPAS